MESRSHDFSMSDVNSTLLEIQAPQAGRTGPKEWTRIQTLLPNGSSHVSSKHFLAVILSRHFVWNKAGSMEILSWLLVHLLLGNEEVSITRTLKACGTPNHLIKELSPFIEFFDMLSSLARFRHYQSTTLNNEIQIIKGGAPLEQCGFMPFVKASRPACMCSHARSCS